MVIQGNVKSVMSRRPWVATDLAAEVRGNDNGVTHAASPPRME